MKLRGWIYVLKNPSLEGLVKVGFSTKDPALRVKELSTTGVPRVFVIAYEALVENPRGFEQRVHSNLMSHHENKEFFRTTPEKAVAAIRAVASEIGVTLQLERCNLDGHSNEFLTLSATPSALVPVDRIFAPSKFGRRSRSDLQQLRKARVDQMTIKLVKSSCPNCGSNRRPSPSGFCESCFGLHRANV
jgi:hypothetical protein